MLQMLQLYTEIAKHTQILTWMYICGVAFFRHIQDRSCTKIKEVITE